MEKFSWTNKQNINKKKRGHSINAENETNNIIRILNVYEFINSFWFHFVRFYSTDLAKNVPRRWHVAWCKHILYIVFFFLLLFCFISTVFGVPRIAYGCILPTKTHTHNRIVFTFAIDDSADGFSGRTRSSI